MFAGLLINNKLTIEGDAVGNNAGIRLVDSLEHRQSPPRVNWDMVRTIAGMIVVDVLVIWCFIRSMQYLGERLAR